MERLELTPRLACIASLIPPGARLVDVGTDHGKLPLYLLARGQLRAAIGTDIHAGPLAHASRNAAEHGLTLPLRLSNGLYAICPEDCDTISIAGMGGETIADILAAAPWTAKGKHLLLLQPMSMLSVLRQWLWAAGFDVERETLCREGRHWYVVLSVRGGAKSRHVPLSQCVVSPALLRAEGADTYLSQLLLREKKALRGMERGAAVKAERLAEQNDTVRAIEQALQALEGML